MKIDWKWLAGILLAVIGILAPIIYSTISEKSKRVSLIEHDIKVIESLLPRINDLYAIADGLNIPPEDPTSFLNATNPNFLDKGTLSSSVAASSVTQKTLGTIVYNLNFIRGKISTFQSIDQSMTKPLKFLSWEYKYLIQILRSEIQAINEDLTDRDLYFIQESIGDSFGKSTLSERYTSI